MLQMLGLHLGIGAVTPSPSPRAALAGGGGGAAWKGPPWCVQVSAAMGETRTASRQTPEIIRA